jgi:hypothetical protein
VSLLICNTARVFFSAVMPREGGASSIPETPVIESMRRGVLDRPIKSGDDSVGVAGSVHTHSH